MAIGSKKMKTRYVILSVFVALIITVLYFVQSPISVTQNLVLSTFKESTLHEFENLEEVKMLKERYNVTRTGENFNTLQSSFAEFYFVEPNGRPVPPFMHLVVIKDLITDQISMIGSCFSGSSEGYRLEQRQILLYLQEYDCFEDKWLTQKILDEKFPPFSIMYRGNDEIFDQDKIVNVIIPSGISDSEKMDLDPSIVTIVIGHNNTVRWINQDASTSTLYSEEPKWTTGIIEPGETATLTFNEPGVYEYNEYNHPWKTGIIVVLEE